MVHHSLCPPKDLRLNEVLPGRLLHVRIPGTETSLDVFSYYQCVWRSQETVNSNKEMRHATLNKLSQSLSALPQRNTLLIAGDFKHAHF